MNPATPLGLAPGKGTAALARITPGGEGDIVPRLAQGIRNTDPDQAFTGEPLRKAAEALAGRIRQEPVRF
ncbi:hypothetical protein ACWCXH_04215 [Kitasatospora sp. NPDC001660]